MRCARAWGGRTAGDIGYRLAPGMTPGKQFRHPKASRPVIRANIIRPPQSANVRIAQNIRGLSADGASRNPVRRLLLLGYPFGAH